MGNYDHLQSEGTRHKKIRIDEEMKTGRKKKKEKLGKTTEERKKEKE